MDDAPDLRTQLTEWGEVLADVIWWFHGYSAARPDADPHSIPDIRALRDIRENLVRMGDGKAPIQRQGIF